jgi:iron(III) transport system substrate-binding protein
VYVALDRAFSEPILERFEDETGIRVDALFDTESTKTIGLAQRIASERDSPRCDVFWNNEVLHTVRLEAEGLLAPYRPPRGEEFPAQYRDSDGAWHGFAARARVLIVNTELVADADFPRSVRDLADPRFRGKTAIAKPPFGTTGTHIACLFGALGPDAARKLLDEIRRNEVQVHSGNKGCARAVADGHAAYGLTDTDDAIIELEAGKPVRIVYPDDFEGGMGTLFLPNTLALVADAPHPAAARKLIDFLLSPEVEEALAASASAQIPLHPAARPSPRLRGPHQVRGFAVDFSQAAAAFDAAAKLAADRFAR